MAYNIGDRVRDIHTNALGTVVANDLEVSFADGGFRLDVLGVAWDDAPARTTFPEQVRAAGPQQLALIDEPTPKQMFLFV
ncbi:hypothetical protein JBE27_00235 [Streptomyces albiflaviniger]|nr:hypothetical protein [Streptomyces albiflaviniger]